jgi:hypothetical protein
MTEDHWPRALQALCEEFDAILVLHEEGLCLCCLGEVAHVNWAMVKFALKVAGKSYETSCVMLCDNCKIVLSNDRVKEQLVTHLDAYTRKL